jgi:SAM-dependent methyltransferase
MTEQSRRFFDAIAARYDRVYAPEAAATRARMTRVLAALPPAPARVLDLGVGTGRELTPLLDAGYVPTGVDISEAMLERCARRARPVPLVRADFWRAPLPFEDASFDAALALHGTLAHPPDDAAVERLTMELSRIVRPGGVFVAEVPSIAWLSSLPPAPPAGGADRIAYRTGDRTCRLEDRVARTFIDARLLDAEAWRAALDSGWQSRVEPLEVFEWLVVALRR